MRVLVTGASGFIGRHVAAELVTAGHDVSTLHRGGPLAMAPAVDHALRHVQADVRSEAARDAAAAADAVVHLAGRGDVQASFREPYDTSHLNAVGTLNLLEGARRRGGHVVLASTQRIYPPAAAPISEDLPPAPSDPYAVSKVVAEAWCRMYAEHLDTPTTVVRLFSVYGPGQVGQGTSGVVSIFLERARRGLPLAVHAEQRRDLTWAGDVARGIRQAIERPPRRERPHRVYNLATGVGTSLSELAELICASIGSASTFAPPSGPSPEGDRIANCARARDELGYLPVTSVREGISLLAEGGAPRP